MAIDRTSEAACQDLAASRVESLLRGIVGEESRLRATTRQFRQGVTGPHFHSRQKLFEDQARQLEGCLCQLKARCKALGGGEVSGSGEDDFHADPGFASVPAAPSAGALIAWHEQLATRLHGDAQLCARALADYATAEILDHLARFHETSAWILRLALDGRDAAL